jgi:hypothetical protein
MYTTQLKTEWNEPFGKYFDHTKKALQTLSSKMETI